MNRNDIINFCLDNGGCLDEENLEDLLKLLNY